MTVWIFSGERPSNGAKALAAEPGFRRLRAGKLVKAKDTVINWGTTPAQNALNSPAAVKTAANKLFTFQLYAGLDVPTVPWTANEAVAKEWLAAGCTVMARQTLTGHSGAGIIILETGGDFVSAPLYTKYIFKVKEYRVHATRFDAFDTQQKVRDKAVEPKCWKVRSHQNGFIFQRNNIVDSDERNALAVNAVKVLGLDFGAVDIVEDKKGQLYVLEVNTAPGLEGQTITAYAKALAQLSQKVNAGD